MAYPVKTTSFTSGTTISAAQVNTNFDDIFNGVITYDGGGGNGASQIYPGDEYNATTWGDIPGQVGYNGYCELIWLS